MAFPAARPEIPVGELAPALAYYRDCLGFKVTWIDETLGLAELSQGASRLFMSSAAYRAAAGRKHGPITSWLNADSREHVDEIYAKWQAAGAILVGPPEPKPWRLYEFFARDPDRNVWRVFYDFAWETRGEA